MKSISKEEIERRVETEYGYLLTNDSVPKGLEKYFNWLRSVLLPEFVIHDQRALENQKRHEFEMRLIYFVSPAVVALVVMQGLFFPEQNWMIWGEVIALLGLLSLYWVGSKRELLVNWVENRYIAERLRCAIFSYLFYNSDKSYFLTKDHGIYVRKVKDDRLRTIFNRLDIESPPVIDCEKDFESVRHFIRGAWINGQKKYHLNCAKKAHRSLKNMERMGVVVIVMTIFFAVLHSLGIGHHTVFFQLEEHAHSPFTIANLLTFFAVVLPAIGASMTAIENAKEYHKIHLRSAALSEELETLEKKATEITEHTEFERMVIELENLFMDEHKEWYSIVAFNRGKVG